MHTADPASPPQVAASATTGDPPGGDKPKAQPAPSAKKPKSTKAESRRRKPHEVQVPGPVHDPGVDSDHEDSEITGVTMITGSDDESADQAPGAEAAEPKRSEDATAAKPTQAKPVPPPPVDPAAKPTTQIASQDASADVDYDPASESDLFPEEESEADPTTPASPQLTESQRAVHPGSPPTPRSAAAVKRAQASNTTIAPPALPKQALIITNAGVDEGIDPTLLRS
ncbi:hypothetical protein PHYPSEUDO_011745 [Phytophthora pseudosyringae]|uniref:Uncharacterized protein n=1 Tax=Phytophthora pseudosyringae TaxID=221518 RepID=A0A8T1VCY0_9STRA|nr:hypothetical protein PHYPSEUDO_011745 [Phytophthora pseudosyringae]